MKPPRRWKWPLKLIETSLSKFLSLPELKKLTGGSSQIHRAKYTALPGCWIQSTKFFWYFNDCWCRNGTKCPTDPNSSLHDAYRLWSDELTLEVATFDALLVRWVNFRPVRTVLFRITKQRYQLFWAAECEMTPMKSGRWRPLT